MDLFSLMQNQAGFYFLIFTRMSGLFLVAPFYGSRNVPQYLKIGFCLLITYILYPLFFRADVVLPDQLLPYLMLVAGELLVGLILGFASSLVFSALLMAGQVLDTQIGFGIVSVIDPLSEHQMPLIGNFKNMLALLVFLSTNSHHLLLSAVVDSFRLAPITGAAFHPAITDHIVTLVVGMFVIAFKICLPVLVALLLTDIALGILVRTMPQMNIFVVGVPGKIIVGIFVLSLALPFYIYFLEVIFSGMYADITRCMFYLR